MKYDTVYIHTLQRDGVEVEIEINYKDATIIECLKDGMKNGAMQQKLKLGKQTISNSLGLLKTLLGVETLPAIVLMFANIDLKPFLKPGALLEEMQLLNQR